MPPAGPATFQPISAVTSTFGPGAACATANSCVNSAALIQPCTSTTTRCISGITEGMPPIDTSDSSAK